jgi:hypothetical protein
MLENIRRLLGIKGKEISVGKNTPERVQKAFAVNEDKKVQQLKKKPTASGHNRGCFRPAGNKPLGKSIQGYR